MKKFWLLMSFCLICVTACKLANLPNLNDYVSSLPRLQVTLSGKASYAIPGYEGVEAETMDGKLIMLDVLLVYKINPFLVDYINHKWGENYADTYLVPTIRAVTQETISQVSAHEIYFEGPKVFHEDLSITINKRLSQDGFIVDHISIYEIRFEPEAIATFESGILLTPTPQ